MYKFYEFFAGGGLARAGLGEQWSCTFANDFEEKKAEIYAQNWGDVHLFVQDISSVPVDKLQNEVDLAWASFPCQDLSLAGKQAGIGRYDSKSITRSGAFWPFWELIRQKRALGEAPRALVLENVVGSITANRCEDFSVLVQACRELGYFVGGMIIDAKQFLPQSRPRFFLVCVRDDLNVPFSLFDRFPDPKWHSSALIKAHSQLPELVKSGWMWFKLPSIAENSRRIDQFVETNLEQGDWDTVEKTQHILSLMNDTNLEKIEVARSSRALRIGTVYRRTRTENLKRLQRAEVRFDGIAGCIRTPGGGSSRQTLIFVKGSKTKTRLLSPREAARLMGLKDSYWLPDNFNQAYGLSGDGVAVPVVRFLAENLLEPFLRHQHELGMAA